MPTVCALTCQLECVNGYYDKSILETNSVGFYRKIVSKSEIYIL